jgi:hypothetical protein
MVAINWQVKVQLFSRLSKRSQLKSFSHAALLR